MLVLESQFTLDCLVHGHVEVVRINQFEQGRLNIQSCFVMIDSVRSWKETFRQVQQLYRMNITKKSDHEFSHFFSQKRS